MHLTSDEVTGSIGVSMGCNGCTCTPRAVKKIRRKLITGKICKCTHRTRSAPQAEQESICRTYFVGGLDLKVYLVVLDRLLRATTKKGRQLFEGKNAPPDKILATPMTGRVTWLMYVGL